MQNIERNLYTAKEQARLKIGKYPFLYCNLYKLWRGNDAPRLVDRTTQVVIEGFPRSGNTFAVTAFQVAQTEDVRIAHHLHVPTQVIRAAHLQIPVLVLIREPADAVSSLVVREPRITARYALNYYISFYRAIAGYRSAYVLGPFEEVTSDYAATIERLNTRFGTHFSGFEHTEANLRTVFSRIEKLNVLNDDGSENRVARPSSARTGLGASVREKLRTQQRLQTLLLEAKKVHRDLIATLE